MQPAVQLHSTGCIVVLFVSDASEAECPLMLSLCMLRKWFACMEVSTVLQVQHSNSDSLSRLHTADAQHSNRDPSVSTEEDDLMYRVTATSSGIRRKSSSCACITALPPSDSTFPQAMRSNALQGDGRNIQGLEEVIEGMAPAGKRRALIPPAVHHVFETEKA